MNGPLALVGGGEWREGCTFDADLLAASGGAEVLVLPTAAAYEHPERAVATAAAHFARLGGTARGLMVLRRADANVDDNAAEVREARFVYLSGGSPMHLRSVLKDSAVWEALVEAWHGGAVLAASSAGAMVLCDAMVDMRGGAFTVGLGLLSGLTVIPHQDGWSPEKARRTVHLAPAGLAVVSVEERTAVIQAPDGAWSVAGAGNATVYVNGQVRGLDVLPRGRLTPR